MLQSSLYLVDTDNIERLIYVDHSGLYIVSANKNPIEIVAKNHFINGSFETENFEFEGEVIEISALKPAGPETVSGTMDSIEASKLYGNFRTLKQRQ